MSVLPVINPADFLPVLQAISPLDYETLVAAWKTQFKALMQAVGLDYDVDGLETDPGVIIAEAYAYLRLTDRAAINDAYSAERLALATGANLDGLAADRGVTRLTYVPATATAPAVMEGDMSLLLRTWLKMQTWGSGSPYGVEYYARTLGLQNLADAHVIDFPGEGRMTCVVLPVPGLSDADTSTLLATIGNGLMARHRRPGAVWIDTVAAKIVTIDYAGAIKIRRGASQAAVLATAQTGLANYMTTRRRIGALAPLSAMQAAQYGTNVVDALTISPATDVAIAETQAAQLGSVNIIVQVVDD